jgi:O-antigen/teichoic acid export membrane protein
MSDEATSDVSSRAPLPEGTLPVGIGLFVSGITAYIFFKVGQVALGTEDFKPIVALWFIMFALVPGFFMPVEQELGRALAHRRALAHGGRPVVVRMAGLAGGIATMLVAGIALASGWLTSDMFEGYGIVTVALVVAVAAYGPFHLARGIASGSGRFVAYGLVMAIDGGVRLAACVALWLAGVIDVGAYAIAVVISPLVAVAVVVARGDGRTEQGPPAPMSEVTGNLGWLLVGSAMGAALVNAGPLAVDILASSDEAAKVTAFGNGVLLARVPLFLFQAVQAALLPRLARLAAKGDLGEFSEGLTLLMRVVAGVAALGTAGAFALGPPVLDLVYDGGLDRRTLTLLALASGLYMLALALAQAVIALRGHSMVAVGWASAVGTFLAVTAVAGDDLFLRVEIGLVSASLVALAIFWATLRSRMARGERPDAEAFIDGIADSPFEG